VLIQRKLSLQLSRLIAFEKQAITFFTVQIKSYVSIWARESLCQAPTSRREVQNVNMNRAAFVSVLLLKNVPRYTTGLLI
jgi:ATP adenylyltransferase/5',5'''-P-1,P-4-tetraphosphate phosphorylase II